MIVGRVYILTGKVYVGQTTRTVEERAQPSSYNQSLAAAIRAAGGIENFNCEEIYCSSKLMMNFLEAKYIYEYNATDPACGFNRVKGSRPVICIETKEVFLNLTSVCRPSLFDYAGDLWNHLHRYYKKEPENQIFHGYHFNYTTEDDIQHPELDGATVRKEN